MDDKADLIAATLLADGVAEVVVAEVVVLVLVVVFSVVVVLVADVEAIADAMVTVVEVADEVEVVELCSVVAVLQKKSKKNPDYYQKDLIKGIPKSNISIAVKRVLTTPCIILLK